MILCKFKKKSKKYGNCKGKANTQQAERTEVIVKEQEKVFKIQKFKSRSEAESR